MNIQSKTDFNLENDPDFNPKLISTNIVGYITWTNPQKFSASPIKYGDLRSIVSAMMAFGSCEPCIWVNGTKHMMEIDKPLAFMEIFIKWDKPCWGISQPKKLVFDASIPNSEKRNWIRPQAPQTHVDGI